MTDPQPVSIQEGKTSSLSGASVVWLIPLLALVLALGLAWQSINDRGPLITIEFEDGAGIAARETELRYRDVRVGVVEAVSFSDGLRSVVAEVRVDKDVAPYVDAGASFWIVQPELTVQGVSGLDTVLSGVFIEGFWDAEIGPERRTFSGLETPPLYPSGDGGLQFALRSLPGGSLTDETPILYRGIEVGRVGPASISQSGNFAIAEAIIYEPHNRLVTPATRFWDTSGFSVSIGAQGAQIDFSSLASLVTGAIAFDTFVSGGASVSDGTVFEVYESQEDARNSVFNASAVELLEVRVIFNENISGLVLDAPVELSGLRIGSVTSLSGIIDEEEFGDNRVRLNVVLGIQPARLGLTGDVTAEAALTFLTERVEQGLRARLASGSLLTGGLKVELVNVENVPEAQIILQEGALATLPSTDSEITDASATVEGVFTRINSLPIEDLLQRAIGLLDSVERWINSEEIRGAPEDLRGLFADLRGVLTSESVQEIPEALSATIRRLDAILAQFEEERAVARILDAIDAATEAASRVGGAVDGVPTLIDELTRVATKAVTLPLEELTTEVSDILASTEALLSAPATQELPASLTRALDELNATLAELREGGAVANVNATLSSTRDAADAVALSAQELPKLVDQINSVFEEASATLAGYNRGDVITRDAQAALRDISAAADALTSLVRLLERNPSALIRGR